MFSSLYRAPRLFAPWLGFFLGSEFRRFRFRFVKFWGCGGLVLGVERVWLIEFLRVLEYLGFGAMSVSNSAEKFVMYFF